MAPLWLNAATMTNDALTHFTWTDLLAVAYLWLGWWGIGRLIERPPKGKPSVSKLMRAFRREWMRQLVTRSPRIFDANVVEGLRQATSFYVSGTMLAIGGGLALIGNGDRLSGVAADISLGYTPEVVLDIKLLVILAFLTDAFLRFVWAHRLFGYCAILMAAVPNDVNHPEVYRRAGQAADVNIQAAMNFNAALRSVYFALGTLPWLVSPWAAMVTGTATLYVLWRREFASHSRMAMMQIPPPGGPKEAAASAADSGLA